jgi:hypothetical protein
MIDRPGILMPDAGLIILLLIAGLALVVLLAAPTINRCLDKI